MMIHSGPWHLVPQTPVGTRPCPPHAGTGCLATRWRQPHHGSQPRRLPPHAGSEGDEGVESWANREYGVRPQPLCELPVQPGFRNYPKTRWRSNGTCSRNM